MWYKLVIFILINSGFAIGVCRSKATEGFRKKIATHSKMLGSLLNCVMCFGLWSSIPVYAYVYKTVDINAIGFMFIGSFTAYFLNRISNILQTQ